MSDGTGTGREAGPARRAWMDGTESGSWARAGLGDAEARYRALFEHAGDALFVLEGGVFVECNRAAEALFGAPRERIVGATPWEFSPPTQPDGRPSEAAARGRIAAALSGEPQRFGWVHRRADGSDRECEVSLARFDAGGGPLILAAVRDLSRIRRARLELEESEAMYRTLVERSHDAVFVYRGGRLLFVNRRAVEMTGRSEEELRTMPVWDLFAPGDRERVVAIADARRRGDPAPERFEARVVTPDGRVRRCEFSIRSIVYDGAPATLGAVRDVTEEREALEALRESEARYRTLFEAASDAIMVFDPGSEEILDANRKACELYGLPREELLGRSLKEFTVDVARGERAIRTVLERGGIQRFETVHRTADGREVVLVCSASVVDLGGRRVIVTVNRDVTGQRRREARLRLLARALESVGEAVVITDPEDRIRWANPAFYRMYGFEPGELDGRHIGVIRHPDLPPATAETIRESTLAGGWRGELLNRTRDGRELVVELVTAPVRDAEGRVEALIGVARDVTEERARQRALAESEQRFRRFFDNDIAANFIASWDGTILACNRRFVEMFGFPSLEEATGASAWELHPSEEARARLLAALEDRGFVEGMELELRTCDGRRVHALLNAVLVRDAGGRPHQVQGHLVDITPLREAEAQLLQAQKMEAIGRLAGGIAHDFNNLLQAMLMDIELTRVRAEAAGPAVLDRLEAQIRRGAALARQLLLFSRRGEARKERVDLGSLLEEDVRLLRRLLPENIALEVRRPGESVPVEVDPVQVEQVLMNLVVNARDAMPEGGRLEIALERRRDRAVVTVADTGHGIPPEIRDRIFEPFFTTKEHGRGTGLGLAVVHGVITSHGGTVSVQSEPGRGTTFTVELPLAAADGAGPGVSPREGGVPVPAAGTDDRVLVVEDDAATRGSTVEILEALGYRVDAAADLEGARRLASGRRYDLLVSDVVLPDGSGAGLAAQLRERWPGLGVLLISGYPEEELPSRRALRGPRLAFLAKPFDAPTLARALAEVARNPAG